MEQYYCEKHTSTVKEIEEIMTFLLMELDGTFSHKGGSPIVSHIRGSSSGYDFNRIRTVVFNSDNINHPFSQLLTESPGVQRHFYALGLSIVFRYN